MAWDDWLKGSGKLDQSNLRQSADFRRKPSLFEKAKDFFFGRPNDEPTKPEPTLPPLTTPIGIPGIGPVRTYYLLLVALLILFILLKNAIIGLLGGLTILFIVAWEFYCGLKTGGLGSELRETIYAILIALMIWFGSGILLHTSTPINAIVSCSMLPAYERGDLVILQGGPISTQYVDYAGPASDINSTATVYYQNQTEMVKGSMLAHCASGMNSDPWCSAFLRHPQDFSETHGPVVLMYGVCPRIFPATGATRDGICLAETSVSSIPGATADIGRQLGGQFFLSSNILPVPFNPSDNLLVYTPSSDELYSHVGDIVHRAAFALNTTTGVVYFSKGDNNPIYDFQAYDDGYGQGNRPITMDEIKGKVIARVPYIGNLKLFITPQVLVGGATAGCDSYYAPQN